MLITAFTSYGDVRAALGVSDDELSDATLSLGLYEDALSADMDDVSPDLESTFAALSVIAEPSAAQKRVLTHTRLFATYSVARQMLTSLPLFAPKSVEDGKARVERQADPLRDTIKSVNAEYNKYRNSLTQALEALGTTATVTTARTYMSAVAPASDPITGT